MIRFAPATATAVPATISAPKPSAIAPKETDAVKEAPANGLLLAELPEVSASTPKTPKTRPQRKSKAKPETTAAVQLDLSA
jgi:hypothetical protein